MKAVVEVVVGVVVVEDEKRGGGRVQAAIFVDDFGLLTFFDGKYSNSIG